jgi:Alpha adaptin AP2, C-terminal domain
MANHSLLDGRISEGESQANRHKKTIFTFFIPLSEKQRAQKVFKAQTPLDLPGAKNKLSGFGMQLLDGIDPNPDNMVCAGIIHTQSHQVGCLLRLEPNKNAQVSMVSTQI